MSLLRTNAFVTLLLKSKHIDERTKRWLTSNNAVPARIYGLPKIHKPDRPLRPAVSTIGAPAYTLSKYLSRILTNIVDTEWNVHSSFRFVQQINEFVLPDEYELVSFDVVSFFTNVGIPRAIQVIKNWNFVRRHTSTPSFSTRLST